MNNVLLAPFTNMSPVELSYQQLSSTELSGHQIHYTNGLSLHQYTVLTDIKDISLNNKTCLALTSRQNVENFFVNKDKNKTFGLVPIDTTFRPIQFTNTYLTINQSDMTVRCIASSNNNAVFRIKCSDTTNTVNIICNNMFVTVDEEYPYIVRLRDSADVKVMNYNRYNFHATYADNTLSLSVQTSNGVRYLCVGRDNIIHATGVYLNNAQIPPYLFIIENNTEIYTFTKTNKWVTYYMDTVNREHNTDVKVRRALTSPINYLISFPLSPAIKEEIANVNISNLKTNFTPTGVGVNINNITTDSNTSIASPILERIANYNINASVLTPMGVVTFSNQGVEVA